MPEPIEMVSLKFTGADGAETEVSVPRSAVAEAVKATHLPKDGIAKELDRRTQALVKNKGYRLPDELLEDEAFVASVIEKHGKSKIDPDEHTASLKAAIDEARKSWETKEYGPAKERIQQFESREQQMLVRDLERQIVTAAAAAGVKPGMLRKTAKGEAAIVAMIADAFGYDEDTGEFFLLDETGDGFELSTNPNRPKGAAPYVTIDEYVNRWADEKDNAEFVTRTGQGGPGGTGRRGEGGAGTKDGSVVWLTPEEAGNSRVYAEALKKVNGDHTKVLIKKAQSTYQM